jgi:hypothetical protein
MDPLQALKEIAQQLNQLSGGMLDLLDQIGGGAEGGAPPAEGGEPPAPPAQ